MRERNSQIGMHPAIQRDTQRMAQHAPQHLVAEIPAHQSVAMMQPDAPALVFHRQGTLGGAYSQFVGEEASQVEVVVAGQAGDLDALLADFIQDAQQPEVAPGDGRRVLEPELEEVAHDVQRAGPPRQ